MVHGLCHLKPDDLLHERRLTYLFRENSIYNCRFQQRKKLKELLGKKQRKLVTFALRSNHTEFVDELTAEQAYLLRKGLGLTPTEFWRASKGEEFYELPDAVPYISEVTLCQVPRKKRQLSLLPEPDE